MKHPVPAYIAFIIAIVFFAIGYVIKPISPQISPIIPTPTRIPTTTVEITPDTSTISQAVTPGPIELFCTWCGAECVAVGSQTTCPKIAQPAGYNCEKRTVNGNQLCQKVKKEEATVICDATNPCPEDQSCVIYSDSIDARPMCVSGNPCDKCPSKKCDVMTSYPGQVHCLTGNENLSPRPL